MQAEEAEPEEGEDEDKLTRFHWQPITIGTARAAAMIAQRMDQSELPFADNLLHESLRSLLSESSTLTALDLRGNGLTRDDADLVLKLLENHETLMSLNMIPVAVDDAAKCQALVMDGTGIERPANVGHDDDMEADEPEGELYSREALQATSARLDEGDGYIFLSLVTPQYFPELRSVTLRKLEIPLDNTLAHVTDALLNLPSIHRLQLSDLKLSGRGASLLLQAVAEMAPRLDSLNGLPLSRLVQMREGGDSGTPLELPAGIEWNDFPLGAMARLNLWQVASFAPAKEDADGSFQLQGYSLTDVGLRGLCVMLRHFAGQNPGAGVRSGGASPFHLTRIDLSDNLQITDATVADLCHTLQHPSMGGSLRHSLRELSVRSCMRLRSRSAYELQNFMHHVREVMRDSGAGGAGSLGLRMINGVDLEALQAAGRTAGSARSSGLPMMLRSFVEAQSSQNKPALAALSECDVHFFAAVLHMYSSIPYCHMHLVIPHSILQPEEDTSEGYAAWGNGGSAGGDDNPFNQVHTVTNDSPFPPPQSSTKVIAQTVQAHLDAAKRLFEAAPISTSLRISVAPCIPGCEDILAEGDHRVFGVVPGSEKAGADPSCFNRIKQRLHGKAAKRRKGPRAPTRPLYVNNINSQRLHCCFRTLYGKGSLYGKDEMELEHSDIVPDSQGSISVPGEVDFSQVFSVATSIDLQHLDLSPMHFATLPQVTEMPVLTHINLNHNHLGDAGVDMLFRALVDSGSSVVHVAVASNSIGDEGATTIAVCLASLPRLTSLELCDNFIQERGSIALAAAIGGEAPPDEAEGEEAAPVGPLPVLSVDLRGNRSRELGARRWAEVICTHPDLKFLCLAQNELGCLTKEYFLDLVCAAVESAALSVLDLQDNFPQPDGKLGQMGPPPADVIEELLPDLPPGEFDPKEVRQAVFIRRHRGGGGGMSEKKGRQPQQGQNGSAQRPQLVQQPGA